jgi:hypothetical protein
MYFHTISQCDAMHKDMKVTNLKFFAIESLLHLGFIE